MGTFVPADTDETIGALWAVPASPNQRTRCYVRLRVRDIDQRFPGLLREVLDNITDEVTPVRIRSTSGDS